MANACVNMRLTSFFVCAIQRVGSSFSDQGWNPCPLQWELLVLITGLPGKSLFCFFQAVAKAGNFLYFLFLRNIYFYVFM